MSSTHGVAAVMLLCACNSSVEPHRPPPGGGPAPVALQFLTSQPDSTWEGEPYSRQLLVNGGQAPYQFALSGGTLPADVVLGTTSGQLTGSPIGSGDFTYRVRVTDAKGDTISQPLQMTVFPMLRITTTSPLPNAINGQPYAVPVQATGGSLPYQWSLVWSAGGTPLFAIDPITGVVTRVVEPLDGLFVFQLQVRDNRLKTATRQVALWGVP